MFEKYECSLFDFSDGKMVGSKNSEFIDAYHSSVKTYLRMMIKMMRRDCLLSNNFRDTCELKRNIATFPDVNVADKIIECMICKI